MMLLRNLHHTAKIIAFSRWVILSYCIYSHSKISRIHERALRLIYSDHVSSFEELLKKDWPFPIHHRNIQSLAIAFYKFFCSLSPSIMKNVFHLNTNISYNLRSRSELYSRNLKRVKYGTETISYLAPKIWSLVPNAIKSSKSLDVFKLPLLFM